MAKSSAKPAQFKTETRAKISQSEFPINTLEQALRIPKGLWENFAGKSAAPHQLAMALDFSPTSGTWRNLCGSAIAYGLSEGGYNANSISLTEIGKRIVAPTSEGDDVRAIKEAVLKPRISRDFFTKYDKGKFPRADIAQNILFEMGLPKERTKQALDAIVSNGTFAKIIMETKTGPFVSVDMDSVPTGLARVPRQDEPVLADDDPPPVATRLEPSLSDSVPRGPKHLFIAHGRNHRPLEDLKKTLDQFKIAYKVAIDEPHAGRPISSKVAQLMKECSAGIFIFTKDQQFFGSKGEEIWRPSENVIYELGAAAILWDRKIIIMKEEGVVFPSDFSDLGYIPFSDAGVQGKALDILKELVGLGLVSVQAM